MWDDETEYEVDTEIEHDDGYSELSISIDPKWDRELCDKLPRPALRVTLGCNDAVWTASVRLLMVNHYKAAGTGRARMGRCEIYSSGDTYELDEAPLDIELEQLDRFMRDVTTDAAHREELLEQKAEKAGAFKGLITSLDKSDIQVLTDLSEYDR